MASKAVVRYRTRTVRRRSHSRSGSGRKISLAIIAGVIPGIAFAAEPVQQGRTWNEAMARLVAAYTGFNYETRTWSAYYLPKGLFPVFAGILAHGIANQVGLNRMISRFHIPVEI